MGPPIISLLTLLTVLSTTIAIPIPISSPDNHEGIVERESGTSAKAQVGLNAYAANTLKSIIPNPNAIKSVPGPVDAGTEPDIGASALMGKRYERASPNAFDMKTAINGVIKSVDAPSEFPLNPQHLTERDEPQFGSQQNLRKEFDAFVGPATSVEEAIKGPTSKRVKRNDDNDTPDSSLETRSSNSAARSAGTVLWDAFNGGLGVKREGREASLPLPKALSHSNMLRSIEDLAGSNFFRSTAPQRVKREDDGIPSLNWLNWIGGLPQASTATSQRRARRSPDLDLPELQGIASNILGYFTGGDDVPQVVPIPMPTPGNDDQ